MRVGALFSVSDDLLSFQRYSSGPFSYPFFSTISRPRIAISAHLLFSGSPLRLSSRPPLECRPGFYYRVLKVLCLEFPIATLLLWFLCFTTVNTFLPQAFSLILLDCFPFGRCFLSYGSNRVSSAGSKSVAQDGFVSFSGSQRALFSSFLLFFFPAAPLFICTAAHPMAAAFSWWES